MGRYGTGMVGRWCGDYESSLSDALMAHMLVQWFVCVRRSLFHQRQGFEIMTKLANGSQEQRKAQDALNRLVACSNDVWPKRCGVKHTAQSMNWKIKRHMNDELRQQLVDVTVPQAEILGLTIPDKDLNGMRKRKDMTLVKSIGMILQVVGGMVRAIKSESMPEERPKKMEMGGRGRNGVCEQKKCENQRKMTK